ncbi:MAG: hypothetical protein A2X94_01850 [Bdellovibrionales bacterium GWB1_55_8]|nr:MAG: hypothetical protein A2X94_01850 [Bdellovibrionales bacterium GWB1_55_8]
MKTGSQGTPRFFRKMTKGSTVPRLSTDSGAPARPRQSRRIYLKKQAKTPESVEVLDNCRECTGLAANKVREEFT